MTAETLIQKWLAPAGIMVFIGGIVWGIQLNISVMQLTQAHGEQRGQLKEIAAMLSSISKTQETTAYIISRIEADFKALDEEVERQRISAEEWNRKIIRLEESGGVKH